MKKRWPLYLLIGVLVAALFLVSVQLTGNAAKNIFAKNPGTQKFPTVSIAPVCTTPTPVVTQSALFCPGVYNHSLTIQGNNIHLKCSQGTIFDGL